jgi:hypothetical protein
MAWSPKAGYWTPNDLSDSELQYLMDVLKKNNEESKLYNKFWCWKMNYRNKNYGLS